MKRKQHQRWKSVVSFLTILILLPYIITVFVNGIHMDVFGMSGEPYVKVAVEDENKEENVKMIPWTEYFIGILGKTMPASYEKEALKAQAVLLRTALYQQASEKGEEEIIFREPYLTLDGLKQKWGAKKFEQYSEKLRTVQAETEDQVLFYGETYAQVPFHQSSCGKTRNGKEVMEGGEYPYLQMKECPKDLEAPDEMQVYQFDYKEIKTRCQAFLEAADGEKEAKETLEFEDFEIQEKDAAGYVSKFRIGNTVCTGEAFRDALSLASSAFSIQKEPRGLKITTMGKGHGVGMSQWTANAMAKDGKDYKEILAFFFEGTNITSVEEILKETE